MDLAVTIELLACPEPTCVAPASVVDRFVLESSDGPVEHIKTSCPNQHGFTLRLESLEPALQAGSWWAPAAGG